MLEQAPTIEAWRQRLIEIILAAPEPPAKPKMTYEEFLAWADEDTLAEWVDGEVIMTSPASDRHQDLARFLTAGLSDYVEAHDLGIIRPAPFQVKLERGREPDLLFLAQAHLARLKPNYVDGPPDLVVEIISPESATRDRGEKFYEYETGGVPECWLIDPLRRRAEFYRLGEFGLYEPIFSGREGVFRSEALPGFWLRVEWLWEDPLPAVDDVLLEIGGDAYARRWIERLRQGGFLDT
ncbi:MAG: Uma2 family endonuclease [Chloroflexi bacterium]|nr:Uma2 family endonuclease [Chloroflexota bacterium]